LLPEEVPPSCKNDHSKRLLQEIIYVNLRNENYSLKSSVEGAARGQAQAINY
jgi:hypothetical protein